MHSIKEIFVVGHGPSSSHTMGPFKACTYIKNKYKDRGITNIKVTLCGSLAQTGKGHFTDVAIDLNLKDYPHQVIFDTKKRTKHPNTMFFDITFKEHKPIRELVLSIGGGSILTIDNKNDVAAEVYPHHYMSEIIDYCNENDLTLADYVRKYEDKDIDKYIESCIDAWKAAADEGIETTGVLPGSLGIKRKAPSMYERLMQDPEPTSKRNYELIMATVATAISEVNASGGVIVIGPTCGSCGVIPGVLAYLTARKTPRKDIINGILTAGLVGQICKTNATVAGAEGGCQAEIGVACSMGAALIAAARGMPNHKVSQAAEIALEHSLGLTCDPVKGYVQVPCIERNAMFALKAKNAFTLAKLIPSETVLIPFDDAVKTMYQTGKDLQPGYKETSKKGLAKLFK